MEISLDLNDTKTVEDMKKKVNDGFEKEHFLKGQKGLVQVVVQEVFDKDGNKMYICTDPSRGMFRFKDKNGNIHFDSKAMKLTDIVYDGVKEKLYTISKEYMSEHERNNNFDQMISITERIMDIKKMTEDNCDFRNELIHLSK